MRKPPPPPSHAPPGAPITPPPVPDDVHVVVLFGGTFDPPHRGHVELSEAVRRLLSESGDVVQLLYVPASRSPFKDTRPEATDQQRVEMLRTAIGTLERTDIWTDELDRARWARKRGGDLGPSYMIDTVRRARTALRPDVRMRLLMGADQAKSFHKWREAGELSELAPPIVLLRGDDEDGSDADALLESLAGANAWSDEQLALWAGRKASVGTIDVSATRIRHLIRTEQPDATWCDLVPKGVYDVIKARGLYWG